MLRLFDNGNRFVVFIEFHYAIAFRIVHIVAEYRCAMLHGCRSTQRLSQTIAVEDIISQHKSAWFARNELFADNEGLGESVWGRLDLVAEIHAILRTVSQETLKVRQILGRGNDEDITNTCHHQYAKRIINHRLVIHRQ